MRLRLSTGLACCRRRSTAMSPLSSRHDLTHGFAGASRRLQAWTDPFRLAQLSDSYDLMGERATGPRRPAEWMALFREAWWSTPSARPSSSTSTCSTRGWTSCGCAASGRWTRCAGSRRPARRPRAASGTPSSRCTPAGCPSCASVEERLCFGRLDLLGGERRYIGRVGLSDDEHRQLLVDWRAPAAEPFYRATAVQPDGVVRRRQLATEHRQVTSIEDEVLDLDAFDPERDGPVVAGEGALMMALDAARTGRMRDIVGTIQAEQDRVIRSPLSGVLVVQGGAGHRQDRGRAAPHRVPALHLPGPDRLGRRAAWSARTSGSCATSTRCCRRSARPRRPCWSRPGGSTPGVDAVAGEDLEVAAVKGDLRMAEVLRRAVRDRQKPLPAAGRARRRRPDRWCCGPRTCGPRTSGPGAPASRTTRPG